jgi:hypothetical protein
VVQVVDVKPFLPLITVGSCRSSILVFFNVKKAFQITYGTSVFLLRCLFVPEITQREAPDVFLQQ